MLAQNEIEVIEQGDEKTRELETQVETIRRASVDAIAFTQGLHVVSTDKREGGYHALTVGEDGIPLADRVHIEAPNGLRVMISDVAHDQFAEKLGIPKPYYQRMLGGQSDLLALNMNRWLQVEPEKRLLRMIAPITPEDNQRFAIVDAKYRLRAFLGATYRPLDNAELIAAVLPTLKEKGAYLKEFSLTDQRLHAKFLTVSRDVKDIVKQYAERFGVTEQEAKSHTMIDGKDISWVNEVVRMGVYLRNSETGFASLDVSGLVEVLKCLNAFVASAQTKQRHVGGKRNGGEDGDLRYISAQTQRLDNAAIFSRVRDTVVAILDEQKQVEQAQQIGKAKATIVEPNEPLFEFIGRMGENLQLTDGETEVLREEIVRSNVVEGSFTQFSLAQGVTALARETKDYDRRVELERVGWTIITQDATKLLAAGKAATKRRN